MRHILLTIGLLGSITLPTVAQTTDISTSTVYACVDLTDDAQRLECYDSAVGRLKAAEETGEVVTVTREQVENVKRDTFGFSMPSLPKLTMPKFGNGDKDMTLKEVQIPIKKVDETLRGHFLIYLDNGQIWEQIDDKRVYYSSRRGAEMALIKKASFGSYMMKMDDGVLFRVKRVQ